MSNATTTVLAEQDSEEIVCFEVNQALFGLPMSQVQEICRDVEVWSIPHAPPEIRGLINLRGRVVTVIDVRSRLGLPPGDRVGGGRNVIVRSEGELIALYVDRINDTFRIRREDVKPAPNDAGSSLRRLLSGVYCRDAQVVSLLNPESLLSCN